jgi:biopolymer transport protein TolR
MQKRNKKDLDFELNLIPFIDLLSVCICFLLLTAVWIQIGSMDVKQAVGGQAANDTAKKPTLWINLTSTGDLVLDVQDSARVPANLRKAQLPGVAGKPNLEQLQAWLGSMKTVEPELATALIQPKADTAYEMIIDIMDRLKIQGVSDLGVVPL